jgi:hypothetical protein
MSRVATFVATIFVLISVAFGFLPRSMMTRSSKNSMVSMNAGAPQQIVGSSVITTTITKAPLDEAQTLLRRTPRGSGFDERFEFISDEEVAKAVSNIDKSFRQHALLMGLQGENWGTAEKLERIRMAAKFEGTLAPSALPGASAVNAGGLLNDWNFEF